MLVQRKWMYLERYVSWRTRCAAWRMIRLLQSCTPWNFGAASWCSYLQKSHACLTRPIQELVFAIRMARFAASISRWLPWCCVTTSFMFANCFCFVNFSIFIGSDDIRNQLPQEAKRFDSIDKAWLKIMSDTAKNTNVLDACSTDGR